MKKAILILLAVCALGMTGCKKSDHNYYIKYRVHWYNGHYYSLYSTITDSDGQLKDLVDRSSRSEYDYLIGPVKTGFQASLRLDIEKYGDAYGANQCVLEIYACRDAEPWVLKSSGGESISYVLDF